MKSNKGEQIMSIFDDIKAKAEELMGGGLEDATGQVTELGEQAKDIIPGLGENEEQK